MFLLCITVLFGVYFLASVLDKVIRSLKVDGFSQKYIFITGCDSGFGHQLALRLDGLGFPVFAACLTEGGQKDLSNKASTRLVTLSLDVTNSESIHKAFEFVQSKLPPGSGLWAIVNNAGIGGPPVPTEMAKKEDFYTTCVINLLGPVEICRKFLPLVRKVKGRVVNMASVMGRIACVPSAYSTSKFGMEGFSDSLRRETYDLGVKVSILEPGFFSTSIVDQDILTSGLKKCYDQSNEEVKKAYGEDFLDKHEVLLKEMRKKANPNTSLVIDAYTHAIVSRYPRTRYVVGWDATLFFVPLSWLPGGVSDWIIMKLTNMTYEKMKNKQN